MSSSRGAYSRRPRVVRPDERWEPVYPHGWAATFLGVSRAQLYQLVRAGQVPGPVLVGGKIRWPLSLLHWISEKGFDLPGIHNNDPRSRPTLAQYRAALAAEVTAEAKRLAAQVQKHTAGGKRRGGKAVRS